MRDANTARPRPLGFWAVWSLTVGVMIGSGVFLLPTVLAPYGLLSFGGWLITGAGSIAIALVLGRLASRTKRTGGPYAFAHDAFGDLPGFLVGWGYWASVWTATAAVAVAFTGYLTVFIPALSDNPMGQAAAALVLIWTLTGVSIRGTREAGLVQLVMTILKLVPLVVIILAGLVFGDAANLPELNPSGGPVLGVLAACALLTMWAFAGMEAGTIPAGEVTDPERTIPRAVVAGVVVTTLVYIAATAAVMLLVPAADLAVSTSPFADAARNLGAWGPMMIAAGALVATAGSMNGNIFISGQMPMAVALDRLAPKVFARLNAQGAPAFSLIAASTLSSILLIANYTRGLVAAFTFMLMISTLMTLAPYLVSALAEFRHSWRSSRAWTGLALAAALYSCFAILGSGLEVIAWGLGLVVIGIPVFYLGRQRD
ncbi:MULTISPECIES: amino acid permease [Hyphobacterium]|uniref:Arginine/agmatine antiporter n=1 Tax=Hyphobacterium vulgare TaxID=1736751 RepID=A0ABV6ZV88_9PROT